MSSCLWRFSFIHTLPYRLNTSAILRGNNWQIKWLRQNRITQSISSYVVLPTPAGWVWPQCWPHPLFINLSSESAPVRASNPGISPKSYNFFPTALSSAAILATDNRRAAMDRCSVDIQELLCSYRPIKGRWSLREGILSNKYLFDTIFFSFCTIALRVPASLLAFKTVHQF